MSGLPSNRATKVARNCLLIRCFEHICGYRLEFPQTLIFELMFAKLGVARARFFGWVTRSLENHANLASGDQLLL